MSIEWLHTSISSGVIIWLTVAYAIIAALSTFDMRIEQAKKKEWLNPNKEYIPFWLSNTAMFGQWGLWMLIFLLNWKYALLLFFIKFILKVLPVLEYLGSYIAWPIVGTDTASLLFEINASIKHNRQKAKENLRKIELDLKKSKQAHK